MLSVVPDLPPGAVRGAGHPGRAVPSRVSSGGGRPRPGVTTPRLSVPEVSPALLVDHASALYARLLVARLDPLLKSPAFAQRLAAAHSKDHQGLEAPGSTLTIPQCASVYRHAILGASQLNISFALRLSSFPDVMHSWDPVPPEDIEIVQEFHGASENGAGLGAGIQGVLGGIRRLFLG